MENSKESDDIQFEEKIDETPSLNIEKDITIKKSTYNKMIKGIVVAIAVATFLGGYSLGTMQDSSLSSDELEEAILGAALKAGSLTPSSIQQPTQPPTQPPGPQLIQGLLDDDPVKGNPDATVTIVEFSDFQCPFCKRFHQTTLPLILENYVDTGKVKFVYRDFPIVGIHPNGAVVTALAAGCAGEQGMFWQYHDKIFENQKNWDRLSTEDIVNTLKAYAEGFDLNTNQFNDCLDSKKYLNEVNKDYQDAISYGVTGTPGFFIGNDESGYIQISGAQPYSVFQKVFDQMLAS